MTDFWSWLVSALIATTILMVAVVLVRDQVRRIFGAPAAYALWVLPGLRLLLPPIVLPSTFATSTSRFSLVGIHAPQLVGSPEMVRASGDAGWDLMTFLCLVWAIGAAFYMLREMWRYADYMGRAQRSAEMLGTRDGIPIFKASVEGPVAAGLLRPVILIPLDFDRRYSPSQQSWVIEHELRHHHRRDLVANVLAAAMMSFHWFNPVAHAAFRAFRADQELACDADVLTSRTRWDRRSYGETLLVATLSWRPPIVCGLGGAAALKRRLRCIAELRQIHPMKSRFAVAGLILFGLALTASIAAPVPIRSSGMNMRQESAVQSVLTLLPLRPPIAAPSTKTLNSPPSHGTSVLARVRAVSVSPANVRKPSDDMTQSSASSEESGLSESCKAELAAGDRGLAAPSLECERERTRQISLDAIQQQVASDPALNVEQRTRALADIERERARVEPAP